MKKRISGRTTAAILVAIAIFLLVSGIHAMTSPISYGSDYYHASFYEGDEFSGSMVFYPDNTMAVHNSNLNEEVTFFYYYKDGYVFFTLATTEAEYEAEVAAINADFEGAVNSPFYASKISAFKLSSQGPDGYESVYLCQASIMMAAVQIVVELALIIIAVASVIRCTKKNTENT